MGRRTTSVVAAETPESRESPKDVPAEKPAVASPATIEGAGTEGPATAEAAGTEEPATAEAAGTEEPGRAEAAGTEDREEIKAVGTEESERAEAVGTEDREKIEAAGTEESERAEAEGAEDREKIEDAGTEESESDEAEGAEDREKIEAVGTEESESAEAEGAEDREEIEAVGTEESESAEAEAEGAGAGASPEDLARLDGAVEALLFAHGAPVTAKACSAALERDVGEVEAALARLGERRTAADSGLQLVRVGGGHQLVTRAEFRVVVARLVAPRKTASLSKPALDTLSVIAYRQPVTVPEVNALRGVDSQHVVGTLVRRRLIRIAGRKKVVGRPLLYATTPEFLETFGLNGLEDLPRLAELGESEGASSSTRGRGAPDSGAASGGESASSGDESTGEQPTTTTTTANDEATAANDEATTANDESTTAGDEATAANDEATGDEPTAADDEPTATGDDVSGAEETAPPPSTGNPSSEHDAG